MRIADCGLRIGLSGWLILAVLIMTACSPRPKNEPSATHVSYESELLKERKDKDETFRNSAQSPLTAEGKTAFKGLNYYSPDARLRIHLKLNRYPLPRRIRIGTNTGEVRSGLRYGYFEFAIDGKPCRLQVYRLDDSPPEGGPSLFVPFRDANSGTETYAAGRYIDLSENTTGMYDLDFNRAYNPYCAYGQSYSCPVPPEENRLGIAIRAGEKSYAH